MLEGITPPENGIIKVRDSIGNEFEIESGIVKPFLYKVSLSSYTQPISNHWLIFPYTIVDGQTPLVPLEKFASYYPKAWDYLKGIQKQLSQRESGKLGKDNWYGYIYKKNLTGFETPKLIVQVISQTGKYSFDNSKLYFTGGGNGPYYGIRWNENNPHSLYYLQGLLNSKLLDFYLHKISSPFRGGYWSYGKRFIEQLPIRTINPTDPADVTRHDKMVSLVERMLDLNKRLPEARTDQEQTLLKRQIAATDKEIDELVYELYGLTDEERKIVEGTT